MECGFTSGQLIGGLRTTIPPGTGPLEMKHSVPYLFPKINAGSKINAGTSIRELSRSTGLVLKLGYDVSEVIVYWSFF